MGTLVLCDAVAVNEKFTKKIFFRSDALGALAALARRPLPSLRSHARKTHISCQSLRLPQHARSNCRVKMSRTIKLKLITVVILASATIASANLIPLGSVTFTGNFTLNHLYAF